MAIFRKMTELTYDKKLVLQIVLVSYLIKFLLMALLLFAGKEFIKLFNFRLFISERLKYLLTSFQKFIIFLMPLVPLIFKTINLIKFYFTYIRT